MPTCVPLVPSQELVDGYMPSKEQGVVMEDLFLWAIASGRKEMAMMLWRRVDRPSFLAMIGKEMCNRIRTKKLPRLAVSAVSDHLQELEAELQVICHLPRPARASPRCGRRAPLIPPFPTAERFAALGQLGAAPRAHTVAPPLLRSARCSAC